MCVCVCICLFPELHAHPCSSITIPHPFRRHWLTASHFAQCQALVAETENEVFVFANLAGCSFEVCKSKSDVIGRQTLSIRGEKRALPNDERLDAEEEICTTSIAEGRFEVLVRVPLDTIFGSCVETTIPDGYTMLKFRRDNIPTRILVCNTGSHHLKRG